MRPQQSEKGKTQVAGRERRRRQHQIPKATFRFVNSTPNSISSVCMCACVCVCILCMPLWHLIDNFVTPRTCLRMHFDNFGVQDLWQVLPLHCYCCCALGLIFVADSFGQHLSSFSVHDKALPACLGPGVSLSLWIGLLCHSSLSWVTYKRKFQSNFNNSKFIWDWQVNFLFI